MEAALNLFWLLISLATFGRQAWHQARGIGKRSHEPWRCCTAAGCALLLLFPVLSLTDDMAGTAFLANDSGCFPSVLKSGGGNTVLDGWKPVPIPAALVLRGAIFSPLRCLGRLGFRSERDPTVTCVRHFEGRAPPSFSLVAG